MRWRENKAMTKCFCATCLNSNKDNNICGKCGSKRYSISPKARTPKKNAPKSEWVKFADMFLKSKHHDGYEQLMITLGKIEKKEEEKQRPKSEKLKHNLQFELVEFLVEYHMFFERPSMEELLRNCRGFNKWTLKDLMKHFETCYNKLINNEVKYTNGSGWNSTVGAREATEKLMTRGELIQTLIFEKAFDL